MEGEEQAKNVQNQALPSAQVNINTRSRHKSMNLTTNLNSISISNNPDNSQSSNQQNLNSFTLSKYQEYCNVLLGRPSSCQDFQNIYQAISLVFADICQMQLPFAEMYKYAGIFIFRKHVYINPFLFSKATNTGPEIILRHCIEELQEDKEERPKFYELMKSIIGDDLEKWTLFQIPENEFSQEILAVLNRFKAVPVDEYDNKIQLDINLTTHSEDIADVEPDESLLESGLNPGAFYASIVDESLKSTKEKCWLLK